MDQRKVSELKAFVQLCNDNPSVLHLPEMGFFKSWLQGSVLLCVVYGFAFSMLTLISPLISFVCSSYAIALAFSVEIDNEGVIEPDTDVPQEMGDYENLEVNAQYREKSEMSIIPWDKSSLKSGQMSCSVF
uniref:Hsp70-interacting protein N-terminal domain-containing protein n=1 Tax=Cyprinus carpio TaxID=7962 RepID=A0A8C1T582_CYPCA